MSGPVRWIEVRASVPRGWSELVAEVLSGPPCTSVVFGSTSVGMDPPPEGFELLRTYLPEHADGDEVRAALRARVHALSASTGASELADLSLAFKALPPEDFATSWRKVWKPFRVGRLCLLSPWHDPRCKAGDLRLTIEPGGVFGSGRHATTRTCLRVLGERVRGGERVLDAGSGSGILAVATLLLGAREAFGFDVDPNARFYANDLARRNGVDARARFETGGFERLADQEGAFDLVLANLYSDVLVERGAELVAALRPGGIAVASGCPAHRVDETRAALERGGLAIEEERRRGRWSTFVGSAAS